MEAAAKIGNMVVLSALWLLCSLPVITAAASSAALYHTAAKVLRHDVGYPAAEFIDCFKKNIRQGLVVGTAAVLLALMCYGLYHYALAWGLSTEVGKLYFILVWMIVILSALILFYLLPVITRFQAGLFMAVRISLYFSLTNLKTVIPMLFTFVGAVLVCYLLPPAVFVVPAAYCYLMTYSVEKTLVSYIKAHREGFGDIENMWFMEE